MTIHSSVGKVKAGVRMPYFIFSDGKQIFDCLTDPTFKILFFGDDHKNGSHQINNVKLKIVAKAFNEVPAALFGDQKNFYILLRPDNHITYIGKDIVVCKEFLLKISPK
jgi:hypothetical protein